MAKDKVVKGFKVFNPDWTCKNKQYACPGKFEEEGPIMVCCHGMHFCQKAVDCFNYYDFDSSNKIAEVIAYGNVLTVGDKSCTDKLEIIREISWEEALCFVNIGKDCTGRGNTGDDNSGNWNTGCKNTGHYNTGHTNTGSRNVGDDNSGNYNSGYFNIGDHNTGNGNAGNRDTGSGNIGNFNAGDWNAGERNTGYYNVGDRNVGDGNTGSGNTGDFNTGDYSTGCFNTVSPKIYMFNKPSDMTYHDWLNSDAKKLLDRLLTNSINIVRDDTVTGGHVKLRKKTEYAQEWWDNLSDKQKSLIKDIPNFDAEIFYKCTGVKVD